MRYLILALLIIAPGSHATELNPSTNYKPQDVIEIVIDALQSNDPAQGDQGIATVFRFASPGNRAFTGPLDRFTKMIKTGFPDMLNHVGSRTEDIVVEGDKAYQPVWLTTPEGKEVGYLFQMGLQQSAGYENMWMTEAVYPLRNNGQSI